MAKKKRQNTAPIGHSNLPSDEQRKALKDPNVFIPKTRKTKNDK